MSIDIMSRLWWREDLATMEKFVALALADAANDDDWVCWPAVETIALKCSISERTVQNALKALAGKGLIRVMHRKDRSSMYVLVRENLPHIERKRRPKEQSEHARMIAEHTGESPAPDLFLTGAAGSGTGAANSGTGESPAPRTINETSEETLLTGDFEKSPGGEKGELDIWSADQETVHQVTTTWNDFAKRHPGIQGVRLPLDDARKNTILNRCKRTAQGQSINEMWAEFFAQIERSEFLQGRAAPGAGRSEPFKLSMTWALKSANFNEIMEGKYGRSGNRPTHDPSGRRMGPAEQATVGALARFRANGK